MVLAEGHLEDGHGFGILDNQLGMLLVVVEDSSKSRDLLRDGLSYDLDSHVWVHLSELSVQVGSHLALRFYFGLMHRFDEETDTFLISAATDNKVLRDDAPVGAILVVVKVVDQGEILKAGHLDMAHVWLHDFV